MSATSRPRRSVLFMPGSNPRALEKARTLPADGLIFDLEDAVAPEAKEGARTIVPAALARGNLLLIRGSGGKRLTCSELRRAMPEATGPVPRGQP